MNLKRKNTAIQGRTASKEVRRQQLIDATIESIAIRGFSETTIAKVSKGANLSQGIINLHFTNKETLFAETLGYLAQEHYDRWSATLEMAGSEPCKQLMAIIEVDFESAICSPKKLAVWFAFWGQAKHRPSYLIEHDKFDKQRTQQIQRLCDLIVEDGDYNDVDPASVARSIVALVDGFWLNLLLYPKFVRRKQAWNDCSAFLSIVFPKHVQHFNERKMP